MSEGRIAQSRTAPSGRARPSILVWALAAVAATITTTALPAQNDKGQPPEPIHVPLGAIHDAKEEARIRASADPKTQWLRVYRVETTAEQTLLYIRQYLGGMMAPPPDSSSLRPGETSAITYAMGFHKFNDECVDPPVTPAAAPSSDAACKVWRRGQDKKRVLGEYRPTSDPDLWIESVMFTWYHRETNGDLTRLQLELRDKGMTPDWKHYMPRTQLIASTTAVVQHAP